MCGCRNEINISTLVFARTWDILHKVIQYLHLLVQQKLLENNTDSWCWSLYNEAYLLMRKQWYRRFAIHLTFAELLTLYLGVYIYMSLCILDAHPIIRVPYYTELILWRSNHQGVCSSCPQATSSTVSCSAPNHWTLPSILQSLAKWKSNVSLHDLGKAFLSYFQQFLPLMP